MIPTLELVMNVVPQLELKFEIHTIFQFLKEQEEILLLINGAKDVSFWTNYGLEP